MNVDEGVMNIKEVSLNMQGVLLCPVCKGTYLHQETTEVFERVGGEDSACMRIIVNSAFDVRQLLITHKEAQGRRQYILISYYCESCPARGRGSNVPYKLRVQQHKGNTYLEWIGWDKKLNWGKE